MQMGVSKESLERKNVEAGIYTFIFTDFKPSATKSGNGFNLNPQMKIIGHAEHNGKPVFYNAFFSEKSWWYIKAWLHSLGIKEAVAADGSESIPGDFIQPDPNKPETWSYNGPLKGRTGKVELFLTQYNGKDQYKPKQFLCAVPGCTEKHPDNLG